MWVWDFWKDALERAVRTAAQVLLGFLVVGETGVLDVDWQQALSVTVVAALASVLMSIVATGIGDKHSAAVLSSNEDEAPLDHEELG